MAREHRASCSPRSTWTRPIGDGLPFASSYSVTFPNPGTYAYHCAIHPGMIGTVVVIPEAAGVLTPDSLPRAPSV